MTRARESDAFGSSGQSPMRRRDAIRRLSRDLAVFAGASLIPHRASGQMGGAPDAGLRIALRLEMLQVTLYQQGLARFTTGTQAFSANELAAMRQIAKHDAAHVSFLSASLGIVQPVPTPRFDLTGGSGGGNGPFATALTSKAEFLKLAQVLKDLAVRAYKGQNEAEKLPADLLTKAMQLHSVEARHAAHVRRLRGQSGWIVGITATGFTTSVAASGVSQADIAKLVYQGEDNVTQLGVKITIAASQATPAFDEPLESAATGTLMGFFNA